MPSPFVISDFLESGATIEQLPSASGTPIQSLVITGLGLSLLSKSAFDKLSAANPGIVLGEEFSLSTPMGIVSGTLSHIPRLAIVSGFTRDLGPCEELARRQRLLLSNRIGVRSDDRGRMGASIATFTELVIGVVDDELPMLQGLRQQLRPQVPDIDLLLSGALLRVFDLDLDYRRQRVLLRCNERREGCSVLPYCRHQSRPACAP